MHRTNAETLACLLIPQAFSDRQAKKYFKRLMLLNIDNSLKEY